jgi:DNA-binding LacI/PurR family transcriptional regulator
MTEREIRFPARVSGRVADALRSSILTGTVPLGRYLPSERSLASEHKVSPRSIRTALKLLESERLIAVEPRKGYRVISRGSGAESPSATGTLALIYSSPMPLQADSFYHRVLMDLQSAAARRHLSLFGILCEGRPAAEVMEQIRGAGVAGVILDTDEPELIQSIAQSGLPAVMVDAATPDGQFDAVMQDGFAGSALAARWLLDRGRKNIALFGHTQHVSRSGLERVGGALAVLAREGIDLPADRRVDLPFGQKEAHLQAARALLSRPDRPTGILALWQGPCRAIRWVAREMGLVPGRDLDIVGWSTEEDCQEESLAGFEPADVPPAVVWSVARMADVCLSRLAERQRNPSMPTTVTKIPVTLRLPNGKEA